MPADSSKITPCIGCGELVPYRTNAKVYCPPCRARRKRERARKTAEAIRRRNGIKKVKGVETACVTCSALFTRMVAKQIRCAPCQELARIESARKHSRLRGKCPDRRSRYNQWLRRKRREDPAFRVSGHMSTLMHRAIGSRKEGRSWREFVDYSLDELMAHLERQFLPGMTWDNHGEWHIDHIVPRASFKIERPGDDEFRRAWALSNLRPLWGRDNCRKNASRTHLI